MDNLKSTMPVFSSLSYTGKLKYEIDTDKLTGYLILNEQIIRMLTACFQPLLLFISKFFEFSEYMVFPTLNSSPSLFNRKAKYLGTQEQETNTTEFSLRRHLNFM